MWKSCQQGTKGIQCSLGVTSGRTVPPRNSGFPSVAKGGWLAWTLQSPSGTHGSTAGAGWDSLWRFRERTAHSGPARRAGLPHRSRALQHPRAALPAQPARAPPGTAQPPALPQLPARRSRSQRSPRRLLLTSQWRRRAAADRVDMTRRLRKKERVPSNRWQRAKMLQLLAVRSMLETKRPTSCGTEVLLFAGQCSLSVPFNLLSIGVAILNPSLKAVQMLVSVLFVF